MADLKFTCAHCQQEIECDELWSGHQIECPTCKKELTVPPKPDAPPHASLASAKPGQARLSIGASRDQRSSAPPPPSPQELAIAQKLAQARASKKGSAKKWITIGAVVVVLGIGGYFGYSYYQTQQEKRAEAARQAEEAAKKKKAEEDAAAAAAAAEQVQEKDLPAVPAVWTLDLDAAKIPKGKANGSICGTNFVAETVRLDKVGAAYLLQLLQGAPASPDAGLMIYLHLNAGENLTNHTWTISPEMKGTTVIRLLKTNPRFAAQKKNIFSGYALKLELGQITNSTIPGKIFIALPPENEQSVVAGMFRANTSITEASLGAVTAAPAVAPAPAATPARTPPPAAQRPAGRKR